MIELRPDQLACVEALRQAYREGAQAPLLVAPCGFGKTVVFSYMARNHIQRSGRRVLILVHRQELIEQVSETLNKFDVTHGFWMPSHRPSTGDLVIVGSVQSVARNLSLPWRPSLVIVDEAHHCIAATSWGKVLAAYDAHVLGVTATPVRLSGEGLGESFDRMVLAPDTRSLIASGLLSPVRVFCPSTPDLSSVHKRAGDYATSELLGVVDRPSITGDAVSQYRSHADRRQAVAFCISVEHARHVAERFRQAGYKAAAIDGGTPAQHRREMVQDFRDRRLTVLASCDLISEGFDVPGIECGICLRPTQSMGLWLQQAGRCLRTAPGKREAILLDHGGNAMRHGLPTEAREWSLVGTRSSDADDERLPGVRVCPKCFAAMSSRARVCVECGAPFKAQPRRVPGRDGELIEMTDEEFALLRARERHQADERTLHVLIGLAKKRGYKDPRKWAELVLQGQRAKKARKARAA